MPGSSDRDYKARLGEVLRRGDPEELHLFLRESAANYGDERQITDVEERSHEEMEQLMHRMILARPDLADLHAASERRLATEAGPPGGRPDAPRPPGARPRRRSSRVPRGSEGPGRANGHASD